MLLNLFVLKCLDSRASDVHTYDHSRVSRKVGGSSRPKFTQILWREQLVLLYMSILPCLALLVSKVHPIEADSFDHRHGFVACAQSC